MQNSGASAPGPDGLPYGVWKSLHGLAVDCLHAVALALAEENAEVMISEAFEAEEHSYNDGVLVFLPKTESGTAQSEDSLRSREHQAVEHHQHRQ